MTTQTEGDHLTAMDLCNRALFTAAVGLILLELVGTFVGKKVIQAGLPVQLTLADIPLLSGLLVLVCSIFNFYTRIIEPLGEHPGAALFSLMGMTAMASLPLVLFFEGLVPFRYLILGIFGALVVLKNWQLQRRFRLNNLGALFGVWKRRALAQSLAGLVSGILFYLLMDPHRRDWLFLRLIGCSALSFKPEYEFRITLSFNVVFFLVASFVFVIDQKELHGLDVSQVVQIPSGNRRGAETRPQRKGKRRSNEK